MPLWPPPRQLGVLRVALDSDDSSFYTVSGVVLLSHRRARAHVRAQWEAKQLNWPAAGLPPSPGWAMTLRRSAAATGPPSNPTARLSTLSAKGTGAQPGAPSLPFFLAFRSSLWHQIHTRADKQTRQLCARVVCLAGEGVARWRWRCLLRQPSPSNEASGRQRRGLPGARLCVHSRTSTCGAASLVGVSRDRGLPITGWAHTSCTWAHPHLVYMACPGSPTSSWWTTTTAALVR